MEKEKIELNLETLENMTREDKHGCEGKDPLKYHEGEDIDVRQLVDNGCQFIIESKCGDVNRWIDVYMKPFCCSYLFQIIDPFVSFCVNGSTSDKNITLTYYGLGLEKMITVKVSLTKDDEKALKIVGLNNFSQMLTTTLIDELVGRIIDYAKQNIDLQ